MRRTETIAIERLVADKFSEKQKPRKRRSISRSMAQLHPWDSSASGEARGDERSLDPN
jgi:hypothetical protein